MEWGQRHGSCDSKLKLEAMLLEGSSCGCDGNPRCNRRKAELHIGTGLRIWYGGYR